MWLDGTHEVELLPGSWDQQSHLTHSRAQIGSTLGSWVYTAPTNLPLIARWKSAAGNTLADATHSLPARARGASGEKGKVLWRFQWFSQQMWGVFWYLRAHGGCFLLEKLKSMGCKLCLKVFTFFNLGTSPSTSEVQLHWDAQPQRREVVREQKVASGLLHWWWCCVSTEGSKTGFPCWMLPSLAPLVASPCTCVQYQVDTYQTTQRSCRDRDRKF